ncbi:group III truncated hemoglobin [Streptomyces sp. NPDC088732]|uniref:group III truncated hemoglobin n=1 Tax=Streptomyces sp. NPDC088732 TaxID=3365879 RepID=UPI0038298F80
MTPAGGAPAARDLTGRPDVEALVSAFYGRAFADPLIGPVFTDVAKMDLAAHMPVMCDFWESVLFAAGLYRRNALHPHLALHRLAPLGPAHFDRWLALWTTTVDALYRGEKAELAKTQAQRIAGSLLRRLNSGDASEFVTIRRRGGAPQG